MKLRVGCNAYVQPRDVQSHDMQLRIISLEVDVGVCGVRPGKTEAKGLDQALQGRPCFQKVQMSGTAAGLEAGERLEPTALDGAHTRCWCQSRDT